ncbi:unnamed protein product [Paramecium octaurelia]|uniref:Phosphatidylinositol-4-phosphate 5-kinase n=1 Tax=Paramecium octaurelia TaxID=43137 RepID=A0A8S1YFF8_PAROT|nr:unnamed protein product [Paramecium octaurelia]CAD8213170.1 unnamed protein product [Paramecium octaurelia]
MIDNLIILRIQSYKNNTKGYSFQELKQLPNFNIVASKNKIYFGQVFNGQKHGKGVLLMDQEHVYEGEFNNNRKHGQGWEFFPSKSYYQGLYVNGKPEGQGKFTWANGEYYEGEWFNGNKHGQGTWMGLKGDMYTGFWIEGKPNGKGQHKWINGDQYKGEFKDSLKHGFGEELFANGDRYVGMYQNGKPEGDGEYFYSSGAYFHGKFKNGLKTGYGEYRCSTYSYKGYYMNDKKHGEGELIYQDGTRKKGKFFNDFYEKTVLRQSSVPNNTQPNETPPKNYQELVKACLKPPTYLSSTKPNTQKQQASPLNKTVIIQRNRLDLNSSEKPQKNLQIQTGRQNSKREFQEKDTNLKQQEKAVLQKKVSLNVHSNKSSPKNQQHQQTIYKQPSRQPQEQSFRFDTTKTSFVTKTGLKGKQSFKQRSYSKYD